jgi:hypothetical protein
MLVFGKKGFPFLGLGAKVRMSLFERCLFLEKKGFPFLGHGAKVRMSLFERCLFSEKKVSRFWDMAQKCA